MLGFAGHSYALFALVWGLMCLVSGAVVTGTMLRGVGRSPAIDADRD